MDRAMAITRILAAVLVPAGALGVVVAAEEPPARRIPFATTARPDVEAWARALQRGVVDGGVRYTALGADPQDLRTYVSSIEGVDPSPWSADRRLAFWINAYNARVIQSVLARYPGIRSVRDVDGFFDRETHPVAGRSMTLDEIEAEARQLDPRSHFAVVCASTSCPDLRAEPYREGRLDRQLEEQTRGFLADPRKGLRYDRKDDSLWLSSIFKWYAGDFTGGSTIVAFFRRSGVVEWILPHLPAALARDIRASDPSVRYMDYDWGLNDRSAGP